MLEAETALDPRMLERPVASLLAMIGDAADRLVFVDFK
jgi:hypothetical protein